MSLNWQKWESFWSNSISVGLFRPKCQRRLKNFDENFFSRKFKWRQIFWTPLFEN